jgi:hypothetical protein
MNGEEDILEQPDNRCAAIKSDGNRCSNPAMSGSRFCFFHNPAKQTERRAAQQKGGLANRATVLSADAADVPLSTAGDIDDVLVHVINLQLRGEITSKDANSIGYNLCQLAKLRGPSNLEERLSALEEIEKRRVPEEALRDPLREEDNDDGSGDDDGGNES